MADRKKGDPAAEGRDSEDGRDDAGKFQVGNRFWELRKRVGDKPMFEGPDELWAVCADYFRWVGANPIYEDRLVTYMGQATHEPVAKMRAMTIEGLCLHIGIRGRTWREWRNTREDLAEVIEVVDMTIYEQQYTGAAADMLNAQIVARKLGLAEKQEHTGKDGGPIETLDVSKLDNATIKALMAARREASEPDAG